MLSHHTSVRDVSLTAARRLDPALASSAPVAPDCCRAVFFFFCLFFFAWLIADKKCWKGFQPPPRLVIVLMLRGSQMAAEILLNAGEVKLDQSEWRWRERGGSCRQGLSLTSKKRKKVRKRKLLLSAPGSWLNSAQQGVLSQVRHQPWDH